MSSKLDASKMPYVAMPDDYVSLLFSLDASIKPIQPWFNTMCNNNIELLSGKALENIDFIIDYAGY